jgi:hypothetical protein
MGGLQLIKRLGVNYMKKGIVRDRAASNRFHYQKKGTLPIHGRTGHLEEEEEERKERRGEGGRTREILRIDCEVQFL